MPTPQETALQLHLAGVGVDQIAASTRLSVEQVDEALADQLEVRQPGRTLADAAAVEQLQTLWRRAYADGVAGDQAAAKLALDIAARLDDVRSRPGTVAEPNTPTEGIRDGWASLAVGAPEAVEALRQLVRSGRSESVRMRAAATLLSRVGITERVEVAASVRMATTQMDPDDPADVGKTSAEVVRERLDLLRDRQRRVQIIDAVPWSGDTTEG